MPQTPAQAEARADYLLQLTFDFSTLDPTTLQGTLTPDLYKTVDGVTTHLDPKGSQSFRVGDHARVEVVNAKGAKGPEIPVTITFDFSQETSGTSYGKNPFLDQPDEAKESWPLKRIGKSARWQPINSDGASKGVVLSKNLAEPGGAPSVAWDFDVFVGVSGVVDGKDVIGTFIFDPEMIVDSFG